MNKIINKHYNNMIESRTIQLIKTKTIKKYTKPNYNKLSIN